MTPTPEEVAAGHACSTRRALAHPGQSSSVMRRTNLAGTPATSVAGSTSWVTTAPAATTASSPTVTPWRIVAPAPLQTLRPMRIRGSRAIFGGLGPRNRPRTPRGTVAAVTLDELVDLCLDFPGAVQDAPFGPDVAVFKVGGKMFALVPLNAEDVRINLKCDPGLAVHLRQQHAAVTPGYHMDKRHWNTVLLDGSLDDGEVAEMVDHSYDLVFAGLTKAARAGIEAAEG